MIKQPVSLKCIPDITVTHSHQSLRNTVKKEVEMEQNSPEDKAKYHARNLHRRIFVSQDQI